MFFSLSSAEKCEGCPALYRGKTGFFSLCTYYCIIDRVQPLHWGIGLQASWYNKTNETPVRETPLWIVLMSFRRNSAFLVGSSYVCDGSAQSAHSWQPDEKYQKHCRQKTIHHESSGGRLMPFLFLATMSLTCHIRLSVVGGLCRAIARIRLTNNLPLRRRNPAAGLNLIKFIRNGVSRTGFSFVFVH